MIRGEEIIIVSGTLILCQRENHAFTITVSAAGHEYGLQGMQTAGQHEDNAGDFKEMGCNS